jgi:RNA polymerase sigma factor (sigma-70 family)
MSVQLSVVGEPPSEPHALLAAAIDGDAAAWNELVTRFSPLVWRVARSYRLNDADAADVVQLTWLRLLENARKLREPRALAGWLSTTARRESLRVCQQAGRVVPVAEFAEQHQIEETPAPDELAERHDRDRRVGQALRRLPVADQQLLGALMSAPRPNYRDTAARLGRPIGSIGPSRARCLTRLQRELAVAGVSEAG